MPTARISNDADAREYIHIGASRSTTFHPFLETSQRGEKHRAKRKGSAVLSSANVYAAGLNRACKYPFANVSNVERRPKDFMFD